MIPRLFQSNDGQIGRRAFWASWLLQGMVAIAFIAVAIFVIDPADDDPGTAVTSLEIGLGVAYLACAATTVTIGIKRLHARGKSGWWSLIAFIPFVGFTWYLTEVGVIAPRRRV